MDIKEVVTSDKVDFTGIESSYFLIGLLSAFENRFQAVADSAMKEISWKQFFAIICINMCKDKPTVKELAEIMGSSHQNVKQILLKLEKKGYITRTKAEDDARNLILEVTSKGMKLRDKASDVPQEMSKCVKLSEDEAKVLYKTLYKILDYFKEEDDN